MNTVHHSALYTTHCASLCDQNAGSPLPERTPAVKEKQYAVYASKSTGSLIVACIHAVYDVVPRGSLGIQSGMTLCCATLKSHFGKLVLVNDYDKLLLEQPIINSEARKCC